MWTLILISFLSLIFLLLLHEAGHFLLAKAFGMEVKEFGLGYPPRVLGKKVGQTLYSLNLLPFGAFVDIPKKSLRGKSFFKGFLVLAAGVFSFFLFAFFLFAFSFVAGAPTQIEKQARVERAWVQIVGVAPSSPARKAGIRPGDIILGFEGKEKVDKVEQAQEFIGKNKGKEVTLFLKRGEKELEIQARPRSRPPAGEGPLGIVLSRVAIQKWSFPAAFGQAAKQVLFLTFLLTREVGRAIAGIFSEVETRLRPSGPVGIMRTFVQRGRLGASYFLQTMGLISLNLAVINLLPFLPVADGGRIVFLALEKIRKKPLNEKIEEGINTGFFILLIALMVVVTVKDIRAL